MTATAAPPPPEPFGDETAELARRIAAARPGEAREAEERLYRALAPRVRLYGLKHLRDEALADDLVQQVMVTVLEGLRTGKVREPERVASYALGTSRMLALDRRRGERRRLDLLDRYATSFETSTRAREPLDLDRLVTCLDGLAERFRAVVLLSFYAERTVAEVAGELRLSEGNVRVIRHRALTRLRDCMDGGSPS